ncbi:MAG TPA: hypothetical protein VK646_00715 [Actinomycetota bacterium]|nr:hypothetical protein [Actinomycetota bacterium]
MSKADDDEVSLVDFVNDLADDPELEALFDLEPIAVMMERGLSVDQQALLMGGTAGEIRDELNRELESSDATGAVAFVIKMLKPVVIKMKPAPGGDH